MLKKKSFAVMGIILSFFCIGCNVLLVKAVVNNLDIVLLYSVLTLVANYLFSVIYTNSLVSHTYEETVEKSLTHFFGSNSFNNITKGEYLQKVVDYPQNFMFIYATIIELLVSLMTVFIVLVVLPKNVRIITACLIPVIFITVLIFLKFRSKEEELFNMQNRKNQESSDMLLNYLNGLDDLRGIGKEQYICDKVFKGKKASVKATADFNFNQMVQKGLFSYSGFIPIIIFLLLNYLFPDFLSEYNVIGCIIASKLILSYVYTAFSEMIEIKLYFLYRRNHEQWITRLSPCQEPVSSCNNVNIIVSSDFSVNVQSFDIKDGDFVHVMGTSGSGKSCFLEYLMGLRNAEKGSAVHEPDMRIAYVGQKSHIFNGTFWDNMLIEKNVSRYETVRKVWADIHLEDDFNRIVVAENIQKHISSGQETIVLFCRALLSDSEYLILDEFDKNLSIDIIDYVLEKSRERFKKIIVVSHIKKEISYTTKILRM